MPRRRPQHHSPPPHPTPSHPTSPPKPTPSVPASPARPPSAQSLQQLIDNPPPNGVIVLTPGAIYDGGVTMRKNGVTVQGVPGRPAIIRAVSGRNTISLAEGVRGVTLNGLDIRGGSPYAIKLQENENVLINACLISDTDDDGIKIPPGSREVTIQFGKISRTGRKTRANAEGIDVVNSSFIHVLDMEFEDIATSPVYFKGGSSNCEMVRCKAKNCGRGFCLGYYCDGEWFTSDNPEKYECRHSRIVECRIEGVPLCGIGLFAAFDCDIENNEIVNCGTADQAAIWLQAENQNGDGRDVPCAKIRFNRNRISGGRVPFAIKPGGAVAGSITIDGRTI